MRIGVVGLGSMGYGIASSLLRAGHAVHGADVNVAAVARLASEGAQRVGDLIRAGERVLYLLELKDVSGCCASAAMAQRVTREEKKKAVTDLYVSLGVTSAGVRSHSSASQIWFDVCSQKDTCLRESKSGRGKAGGERERERSGLGVAGGAGVVAERDRGAARGAGAGSGAVSGRVGRVGQ